MKLLGLLDSPFVRRVGVALNHYGLPFENVELSVWRHADELAQFNPLRKAPTLILDDGTVIPDSEICLLVIDELVCDLNGDDWDRLLLPRRGEQRRRGLRLCGFATGAMEKAVSLVYETRMRDRPFAPWVARCRAQIGGTLQLLEEELQQEHTKFYLGKELSHADIAVTCLVSFVEAAHPELAETIGFPRLRELAAQCESTAAFSEANLPFFV